MLIASCSLAIGLRSSDLVYCFNKYIAMLKQQTYATNDKNKNDTSTSEFSITANPTGKHGEA